MYSKNTSTTVGLYSLGTTKISHLKVEGCSVTRLPTTLVDCFVNTDLTKMVLLEELYIVGQCNRITLPSHKLKYYGYGDTRNTTQFTCYFKQCP